MNRDVRAASTAVLVTIAVIPVVRSGVVIATTMIIARATVIMVAVITLLDAA